MALIAGPTASGKSDLAVRLAQRIEASGRPSAVVNADSQQVYADLEILSARPGKHEMGGIEHRLFGTWDGAQPCSAADWAGQAKHEIADLHARGGVPVLCGGTGLYIRTLLDGISPVPPIDPDIRAEVRALPVEALRKHLITEDPASAARLNERDIQRMSRALEVVRSTGQSLGWWQERKAGGIAEDISLHPLVLIPDRDWLYERCDRRFDWMLEVGAIEEVATLAKRGLDPTLPVMRAIGVPEILAYLDDELDLASVAEAGKTATRQYAKRQFTWFRNQPPRDWPRVDNKTIAEYDFFISLFQRGG